MVSAEAFLRVFQAKFRNDYFTCFAVDHDERQYLVTAKHCIEGLDPSEFKLFREQEWIDPRIRLVGYGENDSDIAVLASEYQFAPKALTLPASAIGLMLTQDVYFLGFPYGMRCNVAPGNVFPTPFIKRAICSGFIGPHLYLDGHNNPGFSGGPVVFRNPGERMMSVAAVVSSYKSVKEKIKLDEKPSAFIYEANTGIIECHLVDNAIDAMKANPDGYAPLD